MNTPRLLTDQKIIKLNDHVYLYKNFFDLSIADKYISILNSHPESVWYEHENYESGDIQGTYWEDKCGVDIISYQDVHDPLIDMLAPTHWTYQHINFIRLRTGQKSEISKHESNSFIDYKIAWYLGDFTGGEIVFPNLNFKYKPEHNDLLIFDYLPETNHYTQEVLSGTRYAYMDYIFPHPGYFMP
jgi:hypothetical protein